MTRIPELTEEQMARAIPARVRKRLMAGQIESGEDIAALRRFVGLTQAQFAEAMGISVHTLLAADGRYGDMCWMPGDLSTCQVVLQTQTAGAVLVGTGGAALVGATVLFVIDARRKRRGASGEGQHVLPPGTAPVE